MSIAEFSATIKSQAYRDWFNRISTDVILKTSVTSLREGEQVAEKTGFYITDNTIKEVITALTDAEATTEQVNSVLQNLKSVVYGRNKKAIEKDPPFADGKSLYYPRVSFDTINRILEAGFKDILDKARQKNPKVNISDYFDRGHVFGIFPKKVSEIREKLSQNTTMDPKGRQLLLDMLTQLEKDLEKEDLETSNLKDEKYTLYSRYKKKRKNYLVELQLRNVNQEAGRAQGPLSAALRKFFNPGKLPVSQTGLKFTGGPGEQKILELIQSKGSPSMVDLLTMSLVDILDGKKSADPTFSIPYQEINSGTVRVNKKPLQAKLRKEKEQARKLKASVRAVPNFKPLKPSLLNLQNLLNLLNTALYSQIVKNMGTGSSRNVLNYRSGRFARSVKLERLTEGRGGMVTAYYSYMKNPYSTFSQGGRQASPASRDPKLLIAKSIRELAQTMVTNRLRAVNV